MEELIKITEEKGKLAVSARELHAFLESKQDFSTWIKNRIDRYDLVENVDFIVFHKFVENPNGGRPQVEYVLTVDAAKELSMVEGNDKGKQARRYFITCEQKLKSFKNSIEEDASVKAIAIDLAIRVLNLNDASKVKLIRDNFPGVTLPDYIQSKGIVKSATALLKQHGKTISARVFNLAAIDAGYLKEIERKSSKGTMKKFKSITEKGLEFGDNQVSPDNPKETQPMWYEEKFYKLMTLIGI